MQIDASFLRSTVATLQSSSTNSRTALARASARTMSLKGRKLKPSRSWVTGSYALVQEDLQRLARGPLVGQQRAQGQSGLFQALGRGRVDHEDQRVCVFEVAVPDFAVVRAARDVPEGEALAVQVEGEDVQAHGRLDAFARGVRLAELQLELVDVGGLAAAVQPDDEQLLLFARSESAEDAPEQRDHIRRLN